VCHYIDSYYLYGSYYLINHKIVMMAAEVPYAVTEPLTIFAPYHCPIARSLDVIGDRWTILILRDLVRDGPRKFQDFERSLRRISPNTLSTRLKRLEDAGIVARRFYEQHPPRAEYMLTEAGEELRPILKALFTWGERHTRYQAAAG
jgi:DNA-binding HxlR family transcriptional regulator